MNITLMILYIAMGRLSYAYWLLKMAGERLLNKKKLNRVIMLLIISIYIGIKGSIVLEWFSKSAR